jgi:MFS family permease
LQQAGKTIERSLDALNFFLADVRDGLGPYLAIYLLTEQKWDEASIGVVMSVAALAGIIAQTPAGALIDRSTAKRALMVAAAIMVTAACLTLPLIDRFELVAATQALAAAAAAIFAPAVAAVTLGIVGPRAFAGRIGRNEAFNHAGNAAAATLAGIAAYFYGPIVVFWLLAAMAVASVLATLSIPADAIDDHVARGLDHTTEGHADHGDKPSGFQVLLACRPLLIFAGATVLFHFSNAAMLPLVGQKLALVNRELGTTLMSVCIVAAQLVMVPVAMLVGRKADIWGSKPIFAAALAVLALRGALYPLSDNPYWLVGVQLLDGVGAGIFWCAVSACGRRSHPGHRTFQCEPGRNRYGGRPWRRAEHGRRWLYRGRGRIQRGVSGSGGGGRSGTGIVRCHDARDRTARERASHWQQCGSTGSLRLQKPAHQRPVLSGRAPKCLSIVPLDYPWEQQSCSAAPASISLTQNRS